MAMRRAVDQSYLLRLWADHIDSPLRVTLVPVGRQDVHYHFVNLDELLAFLEGVAQRSPPEEGGGRPEGSPGPP